MNDFRIIPNLFISWVSEIKDYRRVHLRFTTPISWRIGRKISDVFKRHWWSTTFSTFSKPIKLIFNYKKIKDSQFWLLITFITKVPHYWAQHFSYFQALSQKDPVTYASSVDSNKKLLSISAHNMSFEWIGWCCLLTSITTLEKTEFKGMRLPDFSGHEGNKWKSFSFI